MSLLRALIVACVVAGLLGPVAASAQPSEPAAPREAAPASEADPSAPEPAEGAGKNMTAFEGGGESVSGLGLMVAAYIVVWVLLVLYVLSLVTRERKLRAELRDIRSRLEELDARLAPHDPSS